MKQAERERESERDQMRPHRHMQAGVENRRPVLLQFSGVSVYRVFAAHLSAYSSGKKNFHRQSFWSK